MHRPTATMSCVSVWWKLILKVTIYISVVGKTSSVLAVSEES